jgi:hypothetical protein
MSRCQFLPPYLLQKVAATRVDADTARCGRRTLALDEELRSRRTTATAVAASPPAPSAVAPSAGRWVVHTADHGTALPGRAVRAAGQPASGDVAVDEAYAGVAASVALFGESLGRDSFDGRGATVLVTVHFDRDYDNAFWDGRQLVFGDGDGRVFDRFTKPVDVLAHEFTHAVTQYTAGLVYHGEPGALNEHVSDVFATCVKQRLLDQHDPSAADWLIGEGIFMPTVNGRALRSMAAPGSAYDDPVLGRDPQVGHLKDYVHTSEDNGGVHLNSGIPNRAFHLAATRLGEPVWESAARIWYAALTSGMAPDSGFTTFARATVTAAERIRPGGGEMLAEAWSEVGIAVFPPAGPAETRAAEPDAAAPGSPDETTVAVRRSGGLAGLTRSGGLRLGADPRSAEVERLLTRIDPARVAPGREQPDRFVYSFWLCGRRLTVSEQALTPELSDLAHLLLDE